MELRCSEATLLRVGLKLTAVVLRGSSIPNKRRPMDQALSSIFWMQKGQPCKGVSVFRSLQRTSWPSSIPIAPYRRQYCFKTQRSFAEKDRSCAECRCSSPCGRPLGRVPKKPVRKPGLPETRPRQARTSHRSRRQCIGLFWASSSVLAAEASRSPHGRCATTRPRHLR